jgi:peptidoglycan/LPS O-acetylase OafA/YrhL
MAAARKTRVEEVPGATQRASRPAGHRLGYRPALDGVRGIAILLVIAWHAYNSPSGGFLGVDLFFVLSGFLITSLLLQEWDLRGGISLPHFYFRRALRLLPALVVVVACYVLLSVARYVHGTHTASDGSELRDALEGAFFGALYISNIVQATSHLLPAGIGHLWSLATEEQFYLLWPLALYGALRCGARSRGLALGLGGVIALLFIHRLELVLRGAPQKRLYFGPDNTFDVILIGCLAGIWFSYGLPRAVAHRSVLRAGGWLGLLVLSSMVAFSTLWQRPLYGGLLSLYAVAAALVVLSVVLESDSWIARSLSFRPLVFVGQISYGLYLWHAMIFFGLQPHLPRSLEIGLTFLCATASYYGVERFFLRLKRQDRAEVERAPLELPAPRRAEALRDPAG